jgi:hypothetical protein
MGVDTITTHALAPLRANTLYFFQIVKEPYSLRLKSPEASKLKLARFQTLTL